MYGKALKQIRIYHGLKQKDLSEDLNLSRSYICELENDSKEPSLDVLKKYSNYFEIPVSSLMFLGENLESHTISEKFRVNFAKKVLDVMKWVHDKEKHLNEKGKEGSL
jgi:transcriptional regulator with XRE-family HTH domain